MMCDRCGERLEEDEVYKRRIYTFCEYCAHSWDDWWMEG